jgi:HSP20 family protein
MLTMWQPYQDWGFGNLRRTLSAMNALRREMEYVFGEFERDQGPEAPGTSWAGWPRTALSDAGDSLVIRSEVPGLSEKELEVTVTADSVAISGERKTDPPEGYSVHRKERGNVRFSRSFLLPVKVDPEQAHASIKHGVLELRLPKAKEAQPKQIAVKTG